MEVITALLNIQTVWGIEGRGSSNLNASLVCWMIKRRKMEKGTGLTSVCLAWAELTFWQLKTLYSVQKSGYICALPGHYCKWSKMLFGCSSS